jgi:hypothetical protein
LSISYSQIFTLEKNIKNLANYVIKIMHKKLS